MPYTLNNYDGTSLTTIADGNYDSTSTSLFLPGPNYLGYGKYLNENLIYLLENFAANTAPSGTNLIGQLWYNKSAGTLNVFTGPTNGYVNITGLTISGTQPLNPAAGNTWFNNTTNQYYFYDGANWDLIGPIYTKNQGISGAIPISIGDANSIGVTHNIIELRYGNIVYAIFNPDSTFVPSPAISGFSTINPGLTINSTINYFSYGNTSVAEYLPTDQTIVSINNAVLVNSNSILNLVANTAEISTILSSTTANVSAINSNIGAYQHYSNSQISSLYTTTSAQTNSITTLNANLGAYQNYANSNITNLTITTTNQTSNINLINSNIIAANTNFSILQSSIGYYQLYANSAITSIQANVASANASIISANTGVVAYVNSLNSSMIANVASANASIISANTGVVAYVNSLNSSMIANVLAANASINASVISLSANAAFQETEITNILSITTAANLNIASLSSNITAANVNIASLSSNITAANLNIASLSSNITGANLNIASLSSNITGANLNIASLSSNITAANLNIATLQTKVYDNSNVASYLPTYTGNITANIITVANLVILAKYTRSQLLAGAVSNVLGAIVIDSTANTPVYFNGNTWCFFSNNTSI